MPAHRIASRDSPQRHRTAANNPVFGDRVARVRRATRLEAARRSVHRMDYRRDRRPINRDAPIAASRGDNDTFNRSAEWASGINCAPSAFGGDSSAQIARRHGKFIVDRRRFERGRAGARDHDYRRTGGKIVANYPSENLADAALYPVSRHRDPDSARHRHAQPRAGRLVIQITRVDHEVGALESHADRAGGG